MVVIRCRGIVRAVALLLAVSIPAGAVSALRDGLQDDAESRTSLVAHEPARHVFCAGGPLPPNANDHCLACHLFRLLGQVTLVAGAAAARSSTNPLPPAVRFVRRGQDPAVGAGSRAPPRSI